MVRAEIDDGIAVRGADSAVPHALQGRLRARRVDGEGIEVQGHVVIGAARPVEADDLRVASVQHVAVEVADGPLRPVRGPIFVGRGVGAPEAHLLLARAPVEDADGADAAVREVLPRGDDDGGLELSGSLSRFKSATMGAVYT
jgi:hypothetical protein